MKKLILATALLFLFTACKSGWSCKKRYCTADNKAQTVVITNVNS